MQIGAGVMADSKRTVVLVADDEPSTRALVANHMRNKGFDVIEAGDGDEAWGLAHTHLPNLVILDVMMPGMSGWEVCRRIREAVSLAHTGVVMLTGIGENLNEMTSPLYGADAYVDKPFEFSELDEKVQETLEQRSGGTMGRPDGGDIEEVPPPSGEGATLESSTPTASVVARSEMETIRANAVTKPKPEKKAAEPEKVQKPAKAKTPPKKADEAKPEQPAKKAPKKAAKKARRK